MSHRLQLVLTAVGKERQLVQFNATDSLQDLYSLAQETWGMENTTTICTLKHGFPPKPLPREGTIGSILVHQDRIQVLFETTTSCPASTTKPTKTSISSSSSPSLTSTRPKRAAAKVASDSFAQVIQAQDELLTNTTKTSRGTKRSRTSQSVPPKKSLSSLGRLEGRRLVDGAIVPGKSTSKSTTKSSSRTKFETQDDVSLALIGALNNQSSGGGGGRVGQVLRGAMRNALKVQYSTSRAVAKVAAVTSRRYTIHVISGDTLRIVYNKGVEGQGDFEEVVELLPKDVLVTVLEAIHGSDEKESLRPTTLAQLSPRVFWNLVHIGHEPSLESVDDILSTFLPQLDWAFLSKRTKKLSEKALENQRQEKLKLGEEEEEGNLEKAQEAIQAVEVAMDTLHEHDAHRRRDRAARAARNRLETTVSSSSSSSVLPQQMDVWQLQTPVEPDDEELQTCMGMNDYTKYASILVSHNVCNWRQLANMSPKDLANWVQLSPEDVEPWIEMAQMESLDEIMVELCDGRPEMVEILRDHAMTGTPKDLANWRHMPDLLYESCRGPLSSLLLLQPDEGNGVTIDDMAKWCHRAQQVLDEWEWITWYATPVD